MEPELIPATNGDDWTVPETDPQYVPAEDPITDESPVDELSSNEDDFDDDDDGEIEVDPDHETPPPPETDPAMIFADLKLIRPLMDAIDNGRVHAPHADSGSGHSARTCAART